MKTIFTCPACKKEFSTPNTLQECEGATMDCPNCNSLLLVKKGTAIDFHKAIHGECEEWPEDGKGTYSVGIEEDNEN